MGGDFLRGGLLKVEIVNFDESGKLWVRHGGENEPFDINLNCIRLHYFQEHQPWTLKKLLRAFWGHLVFGPVTRVICKAQDLNIWYNPLDDNQPRQYLGDNREILKRFTRDEIRNQISFEYDFYFGFCGILDRKLHGAEKIDSYHFSSPNFHQPLIMMSETAINHPMDVLKTSTYSVIPPAVDTLICGIPVKSKRGISLARWWTCPKAFYEFWKLLMANQPPRYSYEIMQRLQWKTTAHGHFKLFQELALCAIFHKTPSHLSDTCRQIFQTLNHLVNL